MTLRRKILITFTMLSLINGLICLFILEAAYLGGDSFNPETGDSLIAPGLFQVAAFLAIGTIVIAYLLFWTIRRLVLDPLDDISLAADRLGAGEDSVKLAISRTDEIGYLAATFNFMAENVLEGRSHLEEKVRDATEKIERTQKELAFAERLAATGRLAAGVAHEINNPLGGVMNAVARLRKNNLQPERKEKYLDVCDEGLKRIQETVRRILDFSRKRPEVAAIRVVGPLLQALELVRHRLAPNHIELELNLGDQALQEKLRVMADPGDLQHVFLNLLMNAIDAMPDGGKLTLSLTQVFSWAVVEIADTGVGLTVEEVSASFDYFHTTKPVGKGTGLGLSIAHHIVVGYHGALTLNSIKGEGTRAAVELPLANRQTAVRQQPAAEPATHKAI